MYAVAPQYLLSLNTIDWATSLFAQSFASQKDLSGKLKLSRRIPTEFEAGSEVGVADRFHYLVNINVD